MLPASATNSLIHGWVSGPDGRGTLDILWTCLVTLFLGSWSALFLNLPGDKSSKVSFLMNKGRWMIVVLLFPEMITGLSAEQWRSARQSVEDFKKLKKAWEAAITTEPEPLTLPDIKAAQAKLNLERIAISPWSMRHAFFIDMGGMILKCPDYRPFPVTAYQLNHLIANGHIEYPGINQREIWDKNKADGFARLLTTLQIVWFSVQCIGRAAQSLALTTLELSTLSFIFCTVNTLYFWTHKPLDVEEPIALNCPTLLRDILAEAEKNIDDEYSFTPLEFIDPPISSTSLVAPFWVGFEATFGKRKETRDSTIKRVPNTRTIPPRGLIKLDILYALIFVSMYFGIHLAAWRFTFPTRVERLLWRISTFILLGLSGFYFFAVVAGNVLAKPIAKYMYSTREFATPMELVHALPRWGALMLHFPFFLGYTMARTYIIIEGFYNLRALPATAYATIAWNNFLPHFS